MNRRLTITPELHQELDRLVRNLPDDMRSMINQRKAKIIIMDGEAFFIDMDMGGKHDRNLGARHR